MSASIDDSDGDEGEVRDYFIPVRFLNIPYEPQMPRPVSYRGGKDTRKKLDNIYAKAGFGTQLTPLIQAYYSSGRSEKFQFGAAVDFLSSKGKLANQQYLDSDAKLFGKYFLESVAIGGDISYSGDVFHYYGQGEADTTVYDAEDIKQRFHSFGFKIDLENHKENKALFDYKAAIRYASLSDINKYSEHNPGMDLHASKTFKKKFDVHARMGLDYTSYSGPYDTSSFIFGLNPWLEMNRKSWGFRAGFNFETDGEKLTIFPDLYFHKNLLEDNLVFYAGWNRGIEKNSYQTLSAVNPFIADSIRFHNSTLEERFGGMRGTINSSFSYNFKVAHKLSRDRPLFVNDTTDMKRFMVIYDTTSALTLHGELAYAISEKFHIATGIDYHIFFKIRSEEEAWHIPAFRWTVSGGYNLSKKFRFGADIFGFSGSWAKLPGDNATKLKGTVDANVNATYFINKNFSVWVMANNVAAIKHERWYNYRSYGFQVIGGIGFTF